MNLFIVEDSAVIQNRLTRMLEEIDDVNLVGIAAGLNDTYQTILAHRTEALILDLQLSDGNGLSLLKKIKASHPHIRVVVLSNHASEANRLLAKRAGADRFLDKSTDFQQIPEVLEQWHKLLSH